MSNRITYANKVALNQNSSVPDINKVNAGDMNEIKEVVNGIIDKTIDMFNDTSGANWKDMLKNKIDYCIANMDSSKETTSAFINGGWAGVIYGFGICSKIGNYYQLLWFSNRGTYYCECSSGNYTYKILDGNNYQTNEQVVGTWVNTKPIYRKVITATGDSNNLQIIGSVNDVDTIVKLDTLVQNGQAFRNGTTSYYGDINWSSQVYFNNGSIVIESGSSYVNNYKIGATIRTIIEYTKTTD